MRGNTASGGRPDPNYLVYAEKREDWIPEIYVHHNTIRLQVSAGPQRLTHTHTHTNTPSPPHTHTFYP